MSEVYETLMQTLYGHDVWAGYEPDRPVTKVEGWNGLHPTLTRLAAAAKPPIVIDVGVWKGQSTISLATSMIEAGLDGCVIAVDTFLGSGEHWSGNEHGSVGEFRRRQGMPDIFEQFLANVWYSGLSGSIIPVPQTSTTAARILQRRRVKAGLVHLDASHAYQDVAADIEAYWPVVAGGGVLMGDDYGWAGVQRAANEFAERIGLPMKVTGPKWFIRKARPPRQDAAAMAEAPAEGG